MIEFLNSPGFISSRSTLGSDISYISAMVFTALFLISGAVARKRKGLAHHRMILISMVTMTLYFLYYYEVRRLGVTSLTDQINFAGPEWVYSKIFRPIMLVHFIVVTFSITLAIYMIINGFKTAARKDDRMFLKDQRMKASKPLWAAGVAWLCFLTWWVFSVSQFGWEHKIMFLALGYFIPAALAALIQKTFPDSERRHRTLGKLCITLFACLLVTSTLAYFLLYVVQY